MNKKHPITLFSLAERLTKLFCLTNFKFYFIIIFFHILRYPLLVFRMYNVLMWYDAAVSPYSENVYVLRYSSYLVVFYSFKKLLGQVFFTEHVQVTAPQRCSIKKGVLQQRKTPVSKKFFCNKVTSSETLTLLKKRLRHENFSINFRKLVLWTTFWKHGSEWLLCMKLVSNTFFGSYWNKNKAIEAERC